MHEIRFVGGGMDGKRGRDEHPPEKVTFTNPLSQSDVYIHVSTDDDGTLVYRKK